MKPREINFKVKPGIFTVTGAEANTEKFKGLRQQIDTHIEMSQKLLAENPNNLIPKERLRVESHLGVLKKIAASIMAGKGKEWVPTEAEVNAMFNAASTLGGFGWRFESTRKAFQRLDDEIRAIVAREGKARKAARHDEIIISSFDPGESGKANCKLVNEQLDPIIRWNKKLKVNEEMPALSQKAYYDRVGNLRAAGQLPPKSKKDSRSVSR